MIRRVRADLATLAVLAADEVLSVLAAPPSGAEPAEGDAAPRPRVLLTGIEVSLAVEGDYVPPAPAAGPDTPRAVGRLRLGVPSSYPVRGTRRRPGRLTLRIEPAAGWVPRRL